MLFLVDFEAEMLSICLNESGKRSGFLTNELRVASYELRVTIYCTSYESLFTYELRVVTYCTSYELIFTYELRVTIY